MAKSLEDLAREAVRLQLEHRSPQKAQDLLNRLSSDTSAEQRDDSTSSEYQRRLASMVARIQADHPEIPADEIIRELEAHGF
jgi:hypothetical protein